MMRLTAILFGSVIAWSPPLAADSSWDFLPDPFEGLRSQQSPAPMDLYFSEAFFHAYQGNYFDAIARLDVERDQYYRLDDPSLNSLHYYVGEAEFSVGDFELDYRLHHKASRAISGVLEGDVAEPVRNEAAFRLAKIQYQKNQFPDALRSLDRMSGDMPEDIRTDAQFLRANIHLSVGRPDEAVEILQRLQRSEQVHGFAAYNLGVALWRAGQEEQALKQLQTAGRIDTSDGAEKAIKDKANLVMGTLLFEGGHYGDAVVPLERVHLEGPFSDQALLRRGWSDMSAERYERAVVPWAILAERDSTSAAVQEAQLALPYAYSKLQLHGRAAVLYGQALESFGSEIGKLEASIESVNEGRFLEALVREEVRHDANWVVNLRELPGEPETFYLTELLASHDFQYALQNYLDLQDLADRLVSWQRSFAAYQDMIDSRIAYFEPLLPGVDEQFRELDSRMRLRLEQYELMHKRLQGLLIMPRPELLATTGERLADQQLASMRERLKGQDDEHTAQLHERINRIQGLLIWSTRTEYDERLTDFHNRLRETEAAVSQLQESYHAYVRVRQAATHSYTGYDTPLKRLEMRVSTALEDVQRLQKRQGHLIEKVTIAELQRRREHLERYRDQARYAMADSYDRATKALQVGSTDG